MYTHPLLQERLNHLKLNPAHVLPLQLHDLYLDAVARTKLFGSPNGSL